MPQVERHDPGDSITKALAIRRPTLKGATPIPHPLRPETSVGVRLVEAAEVAVIALIQRLVGGLKALVFIDRELLGVGGDRIAAARPTSVVQTDPQ